MSEQTPKYRKLAAIYRAQVMSGELPPGSALPSRRALVKLHNTSRVTIDKVIDLLTGERILEPSEGNRRPVVADVSQRVPTTKDRVESAATTGRALAPNESSRILSVEMTPCPADIAPLLGVKVGEPVLCRVRLSMRNGEPVATGRSYYTQEVVDCTPELREPNSIPEGSRELAAKRMGSRQANKSGFFTSRLATDEERELLNLGGLYTAVSQTIRRVSLKNGKVVEVGVKVTEGSRPVPFESDL